MVKFRFSPKCQCTREKSSLQFISPIVVFHMLLSAETKVVLEKTAFCEQNNLYKSVHRTGCDILGLP